MSEYQKGLITQQIIIGILIGAVLLFLTRRDKDGLTFWEKLQKLVDPKGSENREEAETIEQEIEDGPALTHGLSWYDQSVQDLRQAMSGPGYFFTDENAIFTVFWGLQNPSDFLKLKLEFFKALNKDLMTEIRWEIRDEYNRSVIRNHLKNIGVNVQI